jgi:hypothetical protein
VNPQAAGEVIASDPTAINTVANRRKYAKTGAHHQRRAGVLHELPAIPHRPAAENTLSGRPANCDNGMALITLSS